jgi:hypothetical protein
MVTIVASWDVRTAEARIHLSLDSNLFDRDTRLSMAKAKVTELEALYADQPVEVVMASARTLDEFRQTDPRFYGA